MSSTNVAARRLTADEINRQMRKDPSGFVRSECERYDREVDEVERLLNDINVPRRVLLLSGPSASGKTGTAAMLCSELRRDGADAFVVSLDDFYRGRTLAPRLPDGSYDYESPDALDLPQLATCVDELLRNGRTMLPQYDFIEGKPKAEKRELVLKHRSVVVFEGIHALHPKLREELPAKHVKRLLIHTASKFYDGEHLLLSRRYVRLIRRMVRDQRQRGASARETLEMWKQVVRGEHQHLLPFVDGADLTIDTVHAFEPCMLAPQALPLLREIPADSPAYQVAQELIAGLTPFDAAPVSLLPKDSILHEFLGD